MAMIQSHVDKGDVSYSDGRLLISLYDIASWASEFSSPTGAFDPSILQYRGLSSTLAYLKQGGVTILDSYTRENVKKKKKY